MALAQKEVRQSTVSDGDSTETVRSVSNPAAERDHGKIVAARVVWFVTGVIITLIALRFLLAALGGNPNNAFVDFIYTLSYPFVAPFFGMFSYDYAAAGASRIEGYDLFAIAIYALLAWGITKAMTLNRHSTVTQ